MTQKLEQVKKFFVDPRNPESVEDLAVLGAEAIRTMAQIYATGGRIDLMSLKTQKWLMANLEGNEDFLAKVLKGVLVEESGTRRFDHRFMGQIHPQGNKVGILANLIAAYMNTNTVVREVSSAENQMESEVLGWSADMFGYDRTEFSGNVVTGGTLANQTALWVARENLWEKLTREGLTRETDTKKMYVLSTEMKHYSLIKACEQLGLKFLPVALEGYKTSPSAMQEAINRVRQGGGEIAAMVGIAGETETAEVDNLNELVRIAYENDVYFHVDAAYGGPFILSRAKDKFNGINRADSITFDPHKMLFTPYSAGVILFKDYRKHMLIEKGMRENARYLLKQDVRDGKVDRNKERNFGMSRVEGSMGSGGVIATYATIKLLEKEGIAALLDHTLDLAQFAYDRVQKSNILRPLHYPDLNTLLVGLNNDLVSESTYNHVVEMAQKRADARGYYVSTNDEVDHGKSAFRFVPTHPFTTVEDVSDVITVLEEEIINLIK